MNVSQFKKTEIDQELWKNRVFGVFWWELIRYECHKRLAGTSKPVKSVVRGVTIKSVVASLISVIRIFFCRYDVLVLTHPRKKDKGGQYIDPYSFEVVKVLREQGVRVLEIEKPGRPAVSNSLDFIDITCPVIIIKVLASVCKLVAGSNIARSISPRLASVGFEAIFNEKELADRVVKHILYVWLYRFLISVTRARKVLVVSSNGNESFISAARQLGLITVELQHGSPSVGKLNYDFPEEFVRQYAPDYFASWGELFYDDSVQVVPSSHVLNIGHPELGVFKSDVPLTKDAGQILVISQPDIDSELRELLLELEPRNFTRRIVVAEHPAYRGGRASFPLPSIENCTVLRAGTYNLYEEILKSDSVLGVFSTALIEACYLDRAVNVIPLSGWSNVDRLIKLGYFNLLQKEFSESDLSFLSSFPGAASFDLAPLLELVLDD